MSLGSVSYFIPIKDSIRIERSFPMSKKILKTLLWLIGITTLIAGIVYCISNKKKNADLHGEDETEDDDLDAMNTLDLSSLKFSRNYVDLR